MFQFKQFAILQDQCAMKVCTDSCIMGAYIELGDAQNVLDIGTGTGLLTLMLAQRHQNVRFTSVEIDENAYIQAGVNFKNSNWELQLNLKNLDITNFSVSNNLKFDHIICNPPFYNNSLKSPNSQKNTAHHEGSLTQEQLLSVVLKTLTSVGKLSLLLPVFEADLFEKKALSSGLYKIDSLEIAHNESKSSFRKIDTYSFQQSETLFSKLYIKDVNNDYTISFKKLLKDYYLIF